MNDSINRKPVVSGRFYPADADELVKTLDDCFSKAETKEFENDLRAIISPHAGYNFSGEVSASAYSQLDKNSVCDNIFILAPSHYVSFNGASIYNLGNYETPLGEVVVNKQIANDLIQNSSLFNYNPEAHRKEHSLEVQLPFLQFWLKNSFNIVPIIIGTDDRNTLKKISEVLLPYFNKDNLFVISSDFSHFPNYNDAIIADQRISDAIIQKKVSSLYAAVEQNNKAKIPKLATSACGLSCILILLHLIENQPEITIHKIKYMNSGDSRYGDHDRVVGYLSFKIYAKSLEADEFEFTEEEKLQLIRLAREAIMNILDSKETCKTKNLELSEKLTQHFGVFVSLHKDSELRGCIGRFESSEPLYKLCEKMAIASAFHDSRFTAVTSEELSGLNIEISVLSPLKKIKSMDEITLGKHGIYIKQGLNKGTLLPQVATNNNWSVKEFLGYCSKHKAGIGWDGWKTAEIYTYTTSIFSD